MAFEPRPNRNPWNRQQQIGLALDTPFTFSRALGENFQQGILDSFGLGSAVRDLASGGNALRPSRTGTGGNPLLAPLEAAYGLRDLLAPDTSRRLTEAEYQASPYFREDIAWDAGFTEDRAASLAAMRDKKKVREHFSAKQPVAAFLGQLGGQMLDPINYVPVFGEAVTTAAVARYGSIAGRMMVSASDAAINTAAFGLVTAQIRGKFGDDVSWQAITSEIATGALIGGAFGGAFGLALRGADRRKAALERVKPRLETLGRVMESRAVLNDAVTGLVDRGEVRLSPNSLAAAEKLSGEVQAATTSQRALQGETRGIAGSKAGEVVISPSGARVSVRPELVEASSLTHAEGNLQVRNRASKQSRDWVEDTATKLDPALLMPNVDGAQGAPLVGTDNIIDSGNGRVMAINRAYDAYPEKAAAYRQALVEAGFPEAAGMERPVLISRRLTELSPEARAQFNAEVNGPTTARLTAVELAAVDRAAMDEGALELLADAPVTAAANRPLVARFLAQLPANERGAMVDEAGNLSADGARRIENALVAAAYGDEDTGILRRFAEATDDNTRAIVGALSDVAGRWARMRHQIKRGEISPDFDMTAELTQAVRLLGRWREEAAREGRPVSQVIREGLAQLDLLSGEISPEAQTFVRMFYQNDHFARAVGREVLAARLGRVIDATEELGRPSLFGDALMPTKGEVLTNAQREQADFFAADGLEPRTASVGEGRGERAAEADRATGRQGTEGSDFKGWFGASKVVDAEGNPLVVYHASPARFDAFIPGGKAPEVSGPAVWFGSDPSHLPAGHNVKQGEGYIYPVHLKIERPLELDSANAEDMAYWRKKNSGFPLRLTAETVADLKETGFDGIIYTNRFEGEHHEYIVFDAEQIKPAGEVRVSLNGEQLASLRAAVDEADAKLEGEAAEAVTTFVGHAPGARDRVAASADFTGAHGIMRAHGMEAIARGEAPEAAAELEAAFAPIRETLRAEIGDTITLHRVQQPVEGDPGVRGSVPTDGQRAALSWSADPKFADDYAGARKDMRVYTEEEIAAFERTFAETGEVKIGGYTLKPEEFLPGVKGIALYSGDEFITDTDGPRAEAESQNRYAEEFNAEQAERRQAIVTAEVALDDVLWITDRAGQAEFIVRNGPGRSVYIDPTGKLQQAGTGATVPTSGSNPSLGEIGDRAPLTPEQRAVEQAAVDRVASLFTPEEVNRRVTDGKAFVASQPARSLDEVYAVIPEHQARLDAVAAELGRQHDAEWKNPGIKKQATAAEKMIRKKYKDTSRLTDLVRGGFVVKTPMDADAIVASLGEAFEVFDEGWVMTAVNYFDRKVLVRFDDGTIGEVQFWHPELLSTKQKRGHALYELSRQIEGENPGDPRLEALFAEQRRLYAAALPETDPAWAPVVKGLLGKVSTPGNAVNSAASLMGRPESTISTLDAGSQASPSSGTNQPLRSSSMTAARDSQSKNIMGETPSSLIDGTEPAPDPVPEGLLEAEARVGQGENLKQLAESHGVAEDGSFVEEADIDQLRSSGVLTPEDEAELLAAQQAFDNAQSYSETLAVAARCVIG